MRKRRIEIAMLAALILFAAGERPRVPAVSIDLRPTGVAAGDDAPHSVSTIRELGTFAVKLLICWID